MENVTLFMNLEVIKDNMNERNCEVCGVLLNKENNTEEDLDFCNTCWNALEEEYCYQAEVRLFEAYGHNQ